MAKHLLEQDPVVIEQTVNPLRCTSHHHITRDGIVPCGIQAVAIFTTRCAEPDERGLICEPLAAACEALYADPEARCALCSRLVTEDWIITRL